MGHAPRILYGALAALSLFSCVNAVTKSSGCGNPLAPGLRKGGTGDSNSLTFTTSDGTKRTYLLHLPADYQPSYSHGLIFSFHGRTKNGTEQEGLSQFSNPQFNPHMLAVYPDGIDNQWQGDPAATTDDVSFTLELMRNLTETYCIDEDQVYAAGKSNGGGFAANILACDPVASCKFAAFAGVSGAYYQETPASGCNADTIHIACNPGRKPVPIFETHGTADTTIPYSGGARRGECLPSIPHFMTEWAKRNGLGARNTTTSLYGGNVIEFDYGMANGHPVDSHYRVAGLGHQWPSTVPNDDGGSTYFNATELIMEFFGNHTLPGC